MSVKRGNIRRRSILFQDIFQSLAKSRASVGSAIFAAGILQVKTAVSKIEKEK